jgi:hypothetical protein
MVLTHELGHLLGGWLGGATLQQFDLAPWRLPYSIHQPDPHPLLTLWMGPLFGAFFPLVLSVLIRRPWADFIADFSVLANGTYLAIAWISDSPQLDTQRLFAVGASRISVAAYCFVTIFIGYYRFRKDCVALFYARGEKTQEPD